MRHMKRGECVCITTMPMRREVLLELQYLDGSRLDEHRAATTNIRVKSNPIESGSCDAHTYD